MDKEDPIIYEPVAGLTIKEAFARAILMSQKEGKPIKALVNDIEIDVTNKTDLKLVVQEYQNKLKEKYASQKQFER